MEWVAIGIIGLWFCFIHLRLDHCQRQVDRLDRIQGGQLYREANRYPPNKH
jgi:hypothetical protein